MTVKILGIAFISVAIACNDSAADRKNAFSNEMKSKEDSLYHEVMAGHDVGMGKMGKLVRSKTAVQKALDSVNALPAAKVDTTYRRQLLTLQEDLNYAEMAMNQWMEEFVLDSAKDNPELRVKYLESEKSKVTKVRDHILGGLQRADSLLSK